MGGVKVTFIENVPRKINDNEASALRNIKKWTNYKGEGFCGVVLRLDEFADPFKEKEAGREGGIPTIMGKKAAAAAEKEMERQSEKNKGMADFFKGELKLFKAERMAVGSALISASLGFFASAITWISQISDHIANAVYIGIITFAGAAAVLGSLGSVLGKVRKNRMDAIKKIISRGDLAFLKRDLAFELEMCVKQLEYLARAYADEAEMDMYEETLEREMQGWMAIDKVDMDSVKRGIEMERVPKAIDSLALSIGKPHVMISKDELGELKKNYEIAQKYISENLTYAPHAIESHIEGWEAYHSGAEVV